MVGGSSPSGPAIYHSSYTLLSSPTTPQIILASSSRYRREILQRLGLVFRSQSPNIDESLLTDEAPENLVDRLSREKALAIANTIDSGLVIGSDQVCVLQSSILGKPKDHDDAVEQLRRASGQIAKLYTGVAVVNAATGNAQSAVIEVDVAYRTLTDDTITRYLEKDQPYDCCGSLKVESLGITLLDYIRSDDPNAITGFPVIRLCTMLRNEGVSLP